MYIETSDSSAMSDAKCLAERVASLEIAVCRITRFAIYSTFGIVEALFNSRFYGDAPKSAVTLVTL